MSSNLYHPDEGSNIHIKNIDEYNKLYQQSINNPSKFFANLAEENLSWMEEFVSVHKEDFADTKWLKVEKLIISLNVIVRHLEINPKKTPQFGKVTNQIISKNQTERPSCRKGG